MEKGVSRRINMYGDRNRGVRGKNRRREKRIKGVGKKKRQMGRKRWRNEY